VQERPACSDDPGRLAESSYADRHVLRRHLQRQLPDEPPNLRDPKPPDTPAHASTKNYDIGIEQRDRIRNGSAEERPGPIDDPSSLRIAAKCRGDHVLGRDPRLVMTERAGQRDEPTLRDPDSRLPRDSGARCDGFKTTTLSARAARPSRINHRVADFTRTVSGAVNDLPIDDQTAAHARPDHDVQEVRNTPTRSAPPFPDSCAAGIIVQRRWRPDASTQHSSKRHSLPSKVRREKNRA
jgi:hypothetical protein